MATSGTGETDARAATDDRRTLVVAVRVPDGAEGDLATEAERRLSRVETVADVTVDGLRGLEPRLSATVATVEVTVAVVGDGLVDELDDAVGVEDVVGQER